MRFGRDGDEATGIGIVAPFVVKGEFCGGIRGVPKRTVGSIFLCKILRIRNTKSKKTLGFAGFSLASDVHSK